MIEPLPPIKLVPPIPAAAIAESSRPLLVRRRRDLTGSIMKVDILYPSFWTIDSCDLSLINCSAILTDANEKTR